MRKILSKFSFFVFSLLLPIIVFAQFMEPVATKEESVKNKIFDNIFIGFSSPIYVLVIVIFTLLILFLCKLTKQSEKAKLFIKWGAFIFWALLNLIGITGFCSVSTANNLDFYFKITMHIFFILGALLIWLMFKKDFYWKWWSALFWFMIIFYSVSLVMSQSYLCGSSVNF